MNSKEFLKLWKSLPKSKDHYCSCGNLKSLDDVKKGNYKCGMCIFIQKWNLEHPKNPFQMQNGNYISISSSFGKRHSDKALKRNFKVF